MNMKPENLLRSIGLTFAMLILTALFVLAGPVNAQTPALEQPTGTPHSTTLACTPGAAVAGATVSGYNFYKSATAGGEKGTAAINGATPVSTCNFVDTNVTQGATAFYVVEAQSSTGNQSAPSNEISVTTPSNPNPPVLSASIVAINVNGTRETVAAQYTDPLRVPTAYELWASGKLLVRGTWTSDTTSHSVTWSGNTSNGVNPVLTVADASGQVASTD
jgi:hypothetical protein